jgi:hypothetical protein
MRRLKLPMKAEWFDPATGWRKPAEEVTSEGVHKFEITGLWDSVLVLHSTSK